MSTDALLTKEFVTHCLLRSRPSYMDKRLTLCTQYEQGACSAWVQTVREFADMMFRSRDERSAFVSSLVNGGVTRVPLRRR